MSTVLVLLTILFFCFVSATPGFNIYSHISASLSFPNITVSSSNVQSLAVANARYSQADCDTLVFAWIEGTVINYHLLYCYFLYGKWHQAKGFDPFLSLREQSHQFSTSFPSSHSWSAVSNRPISRSIAVADTPSGIMIGVSWCSSHQSNLYVAQTCSRSWTCPYTCYYTCCSTSYGVQTCRTCARTCTRSCSCSRSDFDIDRDVLGICSYRIFHSIKLHEPFNGHGAVQIGPHVTPQVYNIKDIPERDEHSNHANAQLPYVHHMAGSVLALRDLDGDGITDIVVGGIYRRPRHLWIRSNFWRFCCNANVGCCGSSQQVVTSDPVGFSGSSDSDMLCNIRLFTGRHGSAYSRPSFSPSESSFPCPLSITLPLSCSSSWLQLNNNDIMDLLVHCTDGNGNDMYRIGYDIDLDGPRSWSNFHHGTISTNHSHTKRAMLQIPFRSMGHKLVSSSGSTYRSNPTILLSQSAAEGLKYRHLWTK
ncbi:hypothetical protein RCL1_000764 [Eukaryota sp. TZLM3-RCL]